MAAHRFDAVISRTAQLSAAAIAACPGLKVISKHGVGVSNIAIEAATRQRVPVYVTPGANAQSVAELAIGLMLAAARRISHLDHELRAGRWTRAQDGLQLGGRRLGLLGFGKCTPTTRRCRAPRPCPACSCTPPWTRCCRQATC